MKVSPFIRVAAGMLLAAPVLHAQWKTETYNLKGGWTAIYLHGDASHVTPAELFKNRPEVLQVWRWNPNPDQIQFSGTPAQPNANSSEWTIWNRNDPDEQTLTGMIGQAAYLVQCSGSAATTIQVPITQKPKPPAATWLITGANFLGFPAASPAPTFSSYFASFPVAIASPSKAYKYIGGDLTSSNPMQVSPTAERPDRNTAYWFEATTVGDFTAPVEYELPGTSGLAFGRTGDLITVGVKNRTTSSMTLTFAPQASEPAPAGQPGVSGTVPLTRRVFDSATQQYVETPLAGGFTVTVPASGRMDLQFGIDRSQMSGDADALFASLLRVTDSGKFTDVYLPVSAQVASSAGLWVGEVSVNSVVSQVAGSPGATTPRAFPLRTHIHVDAQGVSRLLSQVFVGTLNQPGNLTGICTKESGLLPSAKADALRLVSSHLPLDRAISGSGGFSTGSELSFVVTIPFDDPTNPFVHSYHPDHDNRDARLAPLPAGQESYNLRRTMRFTFTAAPPDGSTITRWGSSVYGGTFSETIEGLNKNPLNVGGTFQLRRISEVADISIN
jgi:hypothetical protein